MRFLFKENARNAFSIMASQYGLSWLWLFREVKVNNITKNVGKMDERERETDRQTDRQTDRDIRD